MLTCPICQVQFKSLSSHLRKHNLKAETFKELYPNHLIISEEDTLKMSEYAKTHGYGKWRKGSKLTEEQKQAQSERSKGENNVFFGKKHSEDTRLKMSKNHADFTGAKNPFKRKMESNPEFRESMSQAAKQRWEKIRSDPKEYIKRCNENSNSAAQAHIDGKIFPYGRGHRQGYFISQKFQDRFYYNSSYELAFLEFCEQSPLIVTVKKSPFRILYNVNGHNHNYIPDFLVNDKILIEIKPVKLLDFDLNPLKFQAGTKFCLERELRYVILTESELNDLTDFFGKLLLLDINKS